MSCLYLDKRGLTLKSEGNVLVVFGETGRLATMPLKLIERICIKGSTQLSASLLAKLGEHDVALLVLQGLQRKPVMMLPSYRKDALRRQVQLQLSLDPDFCVGFAKKLVLQKISGQIAHLESLPSMVKNRSALSSLLDYRDSLMARISEVSELDELLGVEGAAANLYFRELSPNVPASLNFTGRNKRPPKDPFNVVLSLGYTLLHYEWVRQIYMMGLDPYIGFYHQPSFGRESLASDLMEPLRPQYDRWALSLFKEGILRQEDFTLKENACQMGKAGRLRFYEAFEKFLQNLLPLIRAQKQLLFADIQMAEARWKSALSFENCLGLFDNDSLEERRF